MHEGPGETVERVNVYRQEMNLPTRDSYGKSLINENDNSVYPERGQMFTNPDGTKGYYQDKQ